MPDLYGPFDTATWTSAQWYRDAWARDMSGVYGGPFGVATVGDLALTVAGLTVTLALGRAHVRGAGYERTGTAWSATLATNTNANPRIDRLVLRRDLAARTVAPLVLQGTPAVSPAAPALTQVEDGVWDLPLFSVQVPGGSGTTLTNIVDERVPADMGALRLPGAIDTSLTGFTNATGWTVTALRKQILGYGMVSVDITSTYGGTAVTSPADGDHTDQVVGTLDPLWRPTAEFVDMWVPGRLAQIIARNDGQVRWQASLPGVSIAPGAYRFIGQWLAPIAR